jgi:hypothetical protein
VTIGEKQRTGHQWTRPEDHDFDKVPVVQYEDGTYGCARPPTGWECTREPGHEGPCAAIQVVDTKPKHIPGCDTPEKALAAVRAWQKEHSQKHIDPERGFRYDGAIGGAYTWETTGTSLGEITVVRCTCGEAIDVSDYDGW